MFDFLVPEERDKLIEEIESMISQGASVDAIGPRIISLTKGLQITGHEFLAPIKLLRGRKYLNKCDRPLTISDLSFPKTHYIKKQGRANRVGTTLFYGCCHVGTVLAELDSRPGENIAVGHWTTGSNLVLNHLGYSENIFREADTLRNTPELPTHTIMVNRQGPNAFLIDYFSRKFTIKVGAGCEHLYAPTIALAEFWLKPEIVNGLLYPSIAAKFNSDNVAVKPSFVQQHMRLTRADFGHIRSRNGDDFDVEWIDSATRIDDDAIKWEGSTDRLLPLPPTNQLIDAYGFLATVDEYKKIV